MRFPKVSMTVLLVAILALLLTSCSRGTKTQSPIEPNIQFSDLPVGELVDAYSNRTPLAVFDAVIDPVAQTFTITPDTRIANYHYPLTQMYPNCLQITGYGFSPNFWADIKLKHPFPGSGIDAFDPRVIAIIPAKPGVSMNYPVLNVHANNSIVLNKDGYTKLHDWVAPSIPGNANPFLAYFKHVEYRRWFSSGTGMMSDTRRWDMSLNGFDGPMNFQLVVDVSLNYPNHPQPIIDNAPEPIAIDAIIGQGLTTSGGSASVTVTVLDWQGQSGIGGVRVEAPDIFNGVVDLDYFAPGQNPNEYIYKGTIENELLAPDGEYTMLVAAEDLSIGIYMYNEFSVIVGNLDHGNLFVGLSGSSPSSAIMLGGTNDNIIGIFELHADDIEAFTIENIYFNLDGWQSIRYLTIEYPLIDGTTAQRTVSPYTYLVSFENLGMYLERNGYATLSIKADLYEIGAGGTFGDRIAVNLNWLEASGMTYGNPVCEDIDVSASSMYLYKTKLSFVSNNVGLDVFLPTWQNVILYRFRVAADLHGDASIKKLTFLVWIGDNYEISQSSDLRNFTFWRGDVNITSDCQITAVSVDNGGSYLFPPLDIETSGTVEGNMPVWVQVLFDNTPADGGEEVVPAGSEVIYSLRALTGTGFGYGDTVMTELLGNYVSIEGANYLSDLDWSLGGSIVALQDDKGRQNYTDVELLWSDMSAINHHSGFDPDGVTVVSSPDWANGYLIGGFPLPSRVLVVYY